MTIALRQWQGEALPVVASTLRRGAPALVSACTGAGKSIFLAALLIDITATLRDGWCVVVTVPTQALVEQLAATLRQHLGRAKVGRWYGKHKEAGAIRVCCLPSLESLVFELVATGTRCALWIGDEVHRAEAYTETLEQLAPRCRLGVTATPYRSDTGLSLWPEVTYRYTMERAISEGVLVPPRIESWSGPKTEVLDALAQMLPMVAGLRGVVGAACVADAQDVAGRLPLRAESIHSGMGSPARRKLLEALEIRDLDALVHVRLLSEGVDLPWLEWLALTTTHSRTRIGLVQEVGRVLRSHPGKREGIILDPLGLCYSVGLTHPADLVAAADEEEKAEKKEEPLKMLPPEKKAIYAVPLDELQRWLIRERWARLAPSNVQAGPGDASEAQLEAIASARKKLRWLSAETRIAIERLMNERPITKRAASALLDVLREASRAAREHYESGGGWDSAPKLSLLDPSGARP